MSKERYEIDCTGGILDLQDTKNMYCLNDSEICQLLNNQDKQIADLEAKLAESEEKIDKLETQSIIDIDHISYYQSQYLEIKDQLAEKEKEKNILTDLLLDVFTKFRTEICNSKDTLSIHDNRVDVYLSYIRKQECLDIATNLEFDTKREINKLKEIK